MATKYVCQALSYLLAEHGVTDVFISPGSRNAPILMAVDSNPRLRLHRVIDERSSAFAAMGMAQESGRAVALVCTSGTALLNYAPAVAEAFYQRLPLIVISADRPAQWIDQDDSQTLRQPYALANFVKYSCNIPDYTAPHEEEAWYAQRCINDALLASTAPSPAPVHINIQLAEPLTAHYPEVSDFQLIREMRNEPALEFKQIKELAESLADKKVMIVSGFMAPNHLAQRGIKLLAKVPNVVILSEAMANLHAPGVIYNIDRYLRLIDADEEKYRPDVVITLGGALVSRHLKTYLRNIKGLKHWNVGTNDASIDTFRHLNLRIYSLPQSFIHSLGVAMVRISPIINYKSEWDALKAADKCSHDSLIAQAGWSSLKAFSIIWPLIPYKANLQLSNGTIVRYAQLFDQGLLHAVNCNRGVSGIDGSTSTAIGAAINYPGPTILITGDMSFAYDIGALGIEEAPDRIKIVVINNKGGGIFRFIRSTKNIDNRENLLCMEPKVDVQYAAKAYGWQYLSAHNESELRSVFPKLLKCQEKCILEIFIEPDEDTAMLNNYFNINN